MISSIIIPNFADKFDREDTESCSIIKSNFDNKIGYLVKGAMAFKI